jgi:hypothetical protein
MGASSLGNKAPFIRVDTRRNEMDREGLRAGGCSLRNSEDLGDQEGMPTGGELVGTKYSRVCKSPGVEYEGES